MAKKTYVLDTNVLLDDLKIFDKFGNNEIVLPFVVLEELDKHKTAKGELGANARNIIRQLDVFANEGDLLKGVISKKTKISVATWTAKCKAQLSKAQLVDMADNRILVTALVLRAAKKPTVLVTNDVSLRIKAKSMGLETQSHVSADKVDSVDDIYSGLLDFYAPGIVIDQLHSAGEIAVPEGIKLLPNEYIHLIDNSNEKHTALGRFNGNRVVKVGTIKAVAGLKPRNSRQAVALDALMDPNITLVSLLGKAGGGKTVISLAAAVEQVFNNIKTYDKIILIKPISFVGEDIGYLPGTQQDKILPHFGNYIDNLIQLFPSFKDKSPEELLEHLTYAGKLEICPPTYLRGRSLPNSFIIVDEVQNLTRHEIKTIATRLGDNSKLVVLGDVNQIDNDRLDSMDNGLTHIIEAFKNETCAAHITFLKGERSTFSSLAADLL